MSVAKISKLGKNDEVENPTMGVCSPLSPSHVTLQFPDTIAPAEKIDLPYRPSKPVLTSPIYSFLHSVESQATTSKQMSKFNLENVKDWVDEHSKLAKTHQEKTKEITRQEEQGRLWSFLKNTSLYLSSILSLVYGAPLITDQNSRLAGAAFIVSGLMGATNLLMENLRGSEWLARQLPIENETLRKRVASLLPIAFGLAASTASFWTLNVQDQANTVANYCLNLAEMIGAVGEGKNHYDVQQMRADAVLTENRKDVLENLERMFMELASAHMEQLSQGYTAVQALLDVNEVMNRDILV